MPIVVEATYEDGVLKPAAPLPLDDRETVQVVIYRAATLADRTFGMIGWSGDADTFDRLLAESEAQLPPDEQQKFSTVEPDAGWAQRTQGLLRWTGDVETLDHLINNPDLEYEQ